ncbi:hypothetical protein [Streptomyces sp. HSG2]|uniref:hypothetical protein n=1 Tax=Streptomyces sp. HSG2 TaxID=2797167 RepID=UPI0019031EFF|nr:hypothetical protein [Streptomyces sp. HSG2]
MRRTDMAVRIAVVVAPMGLLTGCLFGSEPRADGPDEAATREVEPFEGLAGGDILGRALAATSALESVHASGATELTKSGAPLEVDIAMDRKGRCAGSLSVAGEGRAELVNTGDALYTRFDETFIREMDDAPDEDLESAVALLADRWLTGAFLDGMEDAMKEMCDLDGLVPEEVDERVAATRAGTATLAGQPAIRVDLSDDGAERRLYVATDGEPWLLRVEDRSEAEPTKIDFTDHNAPVSAEKPEGYVLDLSEL